MKHNFERVNVWIKISVFTMVTLFAFAFLDSETDLVYECYDAVEHILGLSLVFECMTITVEFIVAVVKTICDKVRNSKKVED